MFKGVISIIHIIYGCLKVYKGFSLRIAPILNHFIENNFIYFFSFDLTR